MGNQSKFHLVKENSFLILCVCFFALFVIIAAVSGAWPGKDISAQFFSAMAGALVAAIITLFLLKGQTAVEADRQKDSKVFEEKLKIYQEFLHKLCEVVKDNRITEEEKYELQFQVSYIAMHTTPSSIRIISDNVKSIIRNIKMQEDKANNMLYPLFQIADVLRYELYIDNNITSDLLRFQKFLEDGEDDNSSPLKRDRKDVSESDDEKKLKEDRKKTINNFEYILRGREEILEYEEEEKKQIVRELEAKVKAGQDLSIIERFKLFKAKIAPNESNSCGLFYRGKLLNYEFYTKALANGKYINSKDTIAIDFLIEDGEYIIRVGTRRNDPEKTKKIAMAIDNEFKPGNTDVTVAHWHVHTKKPLDTSNDEMVRIMNELLAKVKAYRDKEYPLK